MWGVDIEVWGSVVVSKRSQALVKMRERKVTYVATYRGES